MSGRSGRCGCTPVCCEPAVDSDGRRRTSTSSAPTRSSAETDDSATCRSPRHPTPDHPSPSSRPPSTDHRHRRSVERRPPPERRAERLQPVCARRTASEAGPLDDRHERSGRPCRTSSCGHLPPPQGGDVARLRTRRACDDGRMANDDVPFIGAPATRALATIGVTRLDQLADRSRAELLALHGFGPRALRIIEEELGRRGMSLQP